MKTVSERLWAEIERGAAGVELPMKCHPWIVEALEAQEMTVNLEWDGPTVTRVCRNVLALRCVSAGEDD